MGITEKIEALKKSEIKREIDSRLKEFESVKGKDAVFSELCFCILTANSSADNCIRVQKEAGKHFHALDEKELVKKLKEAGCRFHTKRAGYIAEARNHIEELMNKLREMNSKDLRIWIADTIKGLGMKEASHFLRNIGYKDLAIVDFHIVDILDREGVVRRPEKLDRKSYLEIEDKLAELGKSIGMNLAELDLYLWYMETGKILK